MDLNDLFLGCTLVDFETVLTSKICHSLICIFIGAELAGAAGARAPPLFDPRPEIL